ncbi:MAG: endonuclease III domain-containing protein [Desulfuromonadales bacterium]|nr:endonuclease III domain-containing protein [Desulfuromonadales bacterium]
MSTLPNQQYLHIQRRLHDHFGSLHWWPADSPFEVAVGAILTQNTTWTNVEWAICNLKQAEALSPERLAALPVNQLEAMIRPSGFYRQKAARLQNLATHLLEDWQGSLADFCAGPLNDARARLLALPGIGPETADSILLYAADRPSFVVDAYTRRIFERIGLLQGQEKYDEIRRMFMQSLPEDANLYNEFHAQIVQLAKTCCRKNKTLCADCPVNRECSFAKRGSSSVTQREFRNT